MTGISPLTSCWLPTSGTPSSTASGTPWSRRGMTPKSPLLWSMSCWRPWTIDCQKSRTSAGISSYGPTPTGVPTPPMIVQGFPVQTLSAEALRERGTGQLPPTHWLHVWWARRPLIAARLAVLMSLLPAWTDPDGKVRPSPAWPIPQPDDQEEAHE